MRFPADESCDFIVVRALRAAGYDVTALVESAARSDDPTVLDLALRESRIPGSGQVKLDHYPRI